jgi:hypothetical protein
MNAEDVPAEHYVYMYRDDKNKVRYIGYGYQAARATSQQSTSHNPQLEAFLTDKNSQYSLEIAGPFATEIMGRAVKKHSFRP